MPHGPRCLNDERMPRHVQERVTPVPSTLQALSDGRFSDPCSGKPGLSPSLDDLPQAIDLSDQQAPPRGGLVLVGSAGRGRLGRQQRADRLQQVQTVRQQKPQQSVRDRRHLVLVTAYISRDLVRAAARPRPQDAADTTDDTPPRASTAHATVHGYPRQGSGRELKKAVEGYWRGRVRPPRCCARG
ncbi:hypothetical protein DQ392_24815 [Streptomyces reniochalinae]|uniref:Uncharacterized protein n=1 Tax=Streptomyces reniochalinae TaxID=2250578 RepID=A0A367EDH5_9ACTN|nr:hypothetical protein DQ392_24815 [Streptomyces reniochalinae]